MFGRDRKIEMAALGVVGAMAVVVLTALGCPTLAAVAFVLAAFSYEWRG